MRTVHTVAELRQLVAEQKKNGKTIGFAPTMGNLHDGHLTLINTAASKADFIVSSIFVNPLQFGAGEDLDNYPRTLTADSEKLQASGCHCLFAPSVDEMYPDGQTAQTRVSVPHLSDKHCGSSRPGHFEGVATVVTKLFGMVQPDVAVFGQKDFQQLAVIRQLTRDLCLPVEIVGVPTARAEDGLALSSRNGYLSAQERQIAPQLYATLQWLANELKSGCDAFSDLETHANEQLEQQGFIRDYIHICNPVTLAPAAAGEKHLVILAAAKLGGARLIDNLELHR